MLVQVRVHLIAVVAELRATYTRDRRHLFVRAAVWLQVIYTADATDAAIFFDPHQPVQVDAGAAAGAGAAVLSDAVTGPRIVTSAVHTDTIATHRRAASMCVPPGSCGDVLSALVSAESVVRVATAEVAQIGTPTRKSSSLCISSTSV